MVMLLAGTGGEVEPTSQTREEIRQANQNRPESSEVLHHDQVECPNLQ